MRLTDTQPRLIRLVLINSCEADYAEIRPERSTHLAGDNGDGKTAILNSLQLLMVDDWAPGVMHFPRDNKTSAMFYFPSNTSHIIYEIRDQVNDHHLIWYVGRTAASKEKYDRFVINGSFSRDMFLDDDNQPRTKESVIEYVGQHCHIEPFSNSKKLRTYLREELKWYPISSDYQSKFNQVNRQLTQLSDMRASDLKRILLDVADLEITEFNFDEDYRNDWSRLSTLSEQLSELDARKSDLQTLKQLVDTHEEIAESLQISAIEAARLANSSVLGGEQECDAKMVALSKLEAEIKADEEKITTLSRKKDELIGLQSKLIDSVNTLEIEKAWAAKTSAKKISETIASLDQKRRALASRLQNLDETQAQGKSLGELNQTKKEYVGVISKLTKAFNEIEHTLSSDISRSGLPLSNKMWSILNRDLLLEFGSVSNHESFRLMVNKFEETGPQCLGIDVPGLEAEPLDELLDPKNIQKKIDETNHLLERIEKVILDFENRAKIEVELARVDSEIFTAKKEDERYKSWQDGGETTLQETIQKLEAVTDDIEKSQQTIDSLRSAIGEQRSQLEKIQHELTAYDRQLERLTARWDKCAYVLKSPIMDTCAFKIHEFANSVEHLEHRISDWTQSEKRLVVTRNKLLKLSQLFGINIADENSSNMLLEQFDNIEQIRENTHKAWSSLSKGVFGTLKELERGLGVLRAEIDSINGLFRKTKVNNLEVFEVNFILHEQETKVFKTLDNLGGPLFQYSNDNSNDRLDEFRLELEKNSRIQISRCFDLSFQYQKIGGVTETIKKLDHVGSMGQRTVVKSVLLLLLISKFKLASKKHRRTGRNNRTVTPVVLDEVGTLGDGHYAEVVEVANKLGFQIFTASPKAVTGAEVVIPLLKNQSNRLVILDQARRPRSVQSSMNVGEEE